RFLGSPAPRGSARAVAAAAAGEPRHAARHRNLLRSAVFALSLRMERALRPDRLALPADPRAARRAVRPAARSEGGSLDRRRAPAGAPGDALGARRHAGRFSDYRAVGGERGGKAAP